MVHRGGFEPPYVIDGQIYSLLPLTTRPPVHSLPDNSNAQHSSQPIKSVVDSNGESSGNTNLEGMTGGLHSQNGRAVQPNPIFISCCGKLELAKGLEPPTL
jgi:hypothetical protein